MQKYDYYLKERPFIAKPLTSFALFSTGDCICQFLEYKKEGRESFSFDPIRNLRQALPIAIFYAPYMHVYLTRVVPHVRIGHLLMPKGQTRIHTIMDNALRSSIHLGLIMPFN